MAPHLTPKEQCLAIIDAAKEATTKHILNPIETKRERADVAMVDITSLRRFLRGATRKHEAKERRDLGFF